MVFKEFRNASLSGRRSVKASTAWRSLCLGPFVSILCVIWKSPGRRDKNKSNVLNFSALEDHLFKIVLSNILDQVLQPKHHIATNLSCLSQNDTAGMAMQWLWLTHTCNSEGANFNPKAYGHRNLSNKFLHCLGCWFFITSVKPQWPRASETPN